MPNLATIPSPDSWEWQHKCMVEAITSAIVQHIGKLNGFTISYSKVTHGYAIHLYFNEVGHYCRFLSVATIQQAVDPMLIINTVIDEMMTVISEMEVEE